MVAGGGGDPATRVGRHAIARPPAQGDGEGLLHRILGQVDVAEDADQGGQRSAGLLTEDPADLRLVEPDSGVAALAVTGCTSRTADQTAAPGSSAPSSAPTTQPTAAPTTRSTAGSAASRCGITLRGSQGRL
jgi:hypothetical protein